MKKALLYLLLFSYTTIICKPVLPLVSDCMAHVFWYSQHMATVHYEHGKYHAHYELQDAAKKNLPEKNNTLKENEQVNIHLPYIQRYDFTVCPSSSAKNKFVSFSSTLSDSYPGTNYPPPRVV
ncbi:MAG: hypothetical protein ABJB86_12365 [Bacteroidota bacterium]